jgi:hypothetical protein
MASPVRGRNYSLIDASSALILAASEANSNNLLSVEDPLQATRKAGAPRAGSGVSPSKDQAHILAQSTPVAINVSGGRSRDASSSSGSLSVSPAPRQRSPSLWRRLSGKRKSGGSYDLSDYADNGEAVISAPAAEEETTNRGRSAVRLMSFTQSMEKLPLPSYELALPTAATSSTDGAPEYGLASPMNGENDRDNNDCVDVDQAPAPTRVINDDGGLVVYDEEGGAAHDTGSASEGGQPSHYPGHHDDHQEQQPARSRVTVFPLDIEEGDAVNDAGDAREGGQPGHYPGHHDDHHEQQPARTRVTVFPLDLAVTEGRPAAGRQDLTFEDLPTVNVRVTTFDVNNNVSQGIDCELAAARVQAPADAAADAAAREETISTFVCTTFHLDHRVETRKGVLRHHGERASGLHSANDILATTASSPAVADMQMEEWRARAWSAETQLQNTLATLAAWEAALPTFTIAPFSRRASTAAGVSHDGDGDGDDAASHAAGEVSAFNQRGSTRSSVVYDRNIPNYTTVMLRASTTLKEQLVKLRLQLGEAELARDEEAARADELESMLEVSRAEAIRLRRQLTSLRQSQTSIGSIDAAVDSASLILKGKKTSAVEAPPPRRGLYLEHVAPEPAALPPANTTTAAAVATTEASPGQRFSGASRIPLSVRMTRQRRRSSKSIEVDEAGEMHTVEHGTYASAMASRFLRLHTESERRTSKTGSVEGTGGNAGRPHQSREASRTDIYVPLSKTKSLV